MRFEKTLTAFPSWEGLAVARAAETDHRWSQHVCVGRQEPLADVVIGALEPALRPERCFST